MKIFVNFANFDMQKYQGISPSNGRKDAYYSSLDSSCRDASNGSRFMSLASLGGKLFAFNCFEFYENNFLSTDSRDIKRPPFDAFRQGESNELRFVIFRSRIGEIMRFENLAENENFS
jgi:hypothetical protein